MKTQLRNAIDQVTGTYWFVPMLLGLGAVALAWLTLRIDGSLSAETLLDFGLVTLNRPDGARALLSTVAGSLITVAGVVFSLTMVVLIQASSQFGPRLLANFMRDRTNQFVLGTFVATFVYCLLVLRVVRVSDEALGLAAVVPHVSIGVALILTFVNVAVLVFFFHHTAESVRVSHVLAGVSRAMARLITETTAPAGAAHTLRLPATFEDDLSTLRAPRGGVLQSVDVERLVEFARTHGATVRMLHMPGAYVMLGAPYAQVHPAAAAPDMADDLADHLTLGEDRSLTQDLSFLFDELLEVALRALSPSMNDPFTAANCVDRITEGLLMLDQRRAPPETHADEDGVVRAFTPHLGTDALARHLFSELRRQAVGDLMVTQHLVRAQRTLLAEVGDPRLRSVLEEELEAMLLAAADAFAAPDVERLRALTVQLQA